MIGENVGNFRITKLLGEGGMGTVYLAEHPGLGRRAAVKVLRADLVCSQEMIQRFFNEARAANAVGHRGIVEASDFGTLPSGSPYIVMEFLDGESLTAHMRRAGRMALMEAIEIADQAAEALGAAHAKGIVHRDLKPDNLFLTPDAQEPGRVQVKILDFGIAKLARPSGAFGDVRTRTGTLMGTPQYMSPEQCRDARDVDHRSDIYSLGVVLYEMVSGTPPFSSHSWGELVHMHIGVPPSPFRQGRPEIPERVEQIVLKALEKDPEARFQSMAELRRALAEIPAARTLVLGVRAEAPSSSSTLRLDAPAPGRVRRTTFGSAAVELRDDAPAPGRPRWLRAAAVGAGALCAVVTAAVVLGAGGRRAEAPPPSSDPVEAPTVALPVPQAVPPVPPVAVAPEPKSITIEIDTDPVGARVVRRRDGVTLGLTPLRQSWARATGDEPLDLERDGYRPERVVVPLDRGLTARLQLASAPRTGVRRAPAPRQRQAKASPRPSSKESPKESLTGAGSRRPSPAEKPAPAAPPPADKKREPLKI